MTGGFGDTVPLVMRQPVTVTETRWTPVNALMFTTEDTTRHRPAGDNWHPDLLGDWDLALLDTSLRLARRKVRAEMKRRASRPASVTHG